MKARLFCTAMAMLCVLAATPALAAEGSEPFPAYGLGDMVVTADRPGARSVAIDSVLTETEIEATGAATVSQALQYMPGVVVTSGRKNEPEISVHGFGQNKLLILIDGVPYYETKYRKLNLDQIPTDVVSRIEVIKGAPSVLYGPNAEVAMVNVITKRAGDKPSLVMRGEVGEVNANRFSISHGMTIDKFNYWVNFTHREGDGFPMSGEYEPQETTVINRPGQTRTPVLQGDETRKNSAYDVNSLWARFGWEPGPLSEYFINLSLVDAGRQVPPSVDSERVFFFRPAFSGFARFPNYRDWGADLSIKQGIGSEDLVVKGKLFYHQHKDDYVSYESEDYREKLATSTYEDAYWGVHLIGDWKVGPGHTLRGSAIYRLDNHDERDDVYLPFTQNESTTTSLGLEYQYDGIKGLVVVAGVSWDRFEVDKAQSNETDRNGDLIATVDLETGNDESEFNPMIGASYTFADGTRLFGSVARKTRFATLSELYSSSSGNPNLGAEKAINYTLGVSRRFLESLDLELSFFYHDISDFVSRDGPGIEGIYQNYGEIDVYGFELGGSWRPLEGLKLFAYYTLAESEDNSPDRVTDDVVGVPKHKVDLGVNYLVPMVGVQVDLRGLYLADRFSQLPSPARPDLETLKDDDYFVANLKLSKELWDWLEVYGLVNNILDADYQPEYGFPAPGRNFWVGFKTTW